MQLETELRLGLPGDSDHQSMSKKRPHSDDTVSSLVGWPPVRRRHETRVLVKVSMDGVPFLRKICLENHRGYDDLIPALERLFGCLTIGGKAFREEEKCEHQQQHFPIYEDKDGDWMLLGDVPWEMFVGSCSRLRIMRKSEATCLGKGVFSPKAKEEFGASHWS